MSFYVTLKTVERDSTCAIFANMEDALAAMALSIADVIGYLSETERKDYEGNPDEINKLARWIEYLFDTEEIEGDIQWDDRLPYLQSKLMPFAWMNFKGNNYDWVIVEKAPQADGEFSI